MMSLPNLLIVDDDEINLILLERIIKIKNVNIIRAHSGADALEKIQGVELVLAILDVRMPVMNGFDLAMAINEKRLGEKVPIIFLTANYVNELDLFKGYGSGAVDFIIKPVSPKILLSKVNVFLDLFNQKQAVIRKTEKLKKIADELARVNSELQENEKVLRESEELFRSVVNNSTELIALTDKNGIVIYVSPQCENVLGHPCNKFLGKQITDIIHPEDIEGYRQAWERVFYKGQELREFEYRIIDEQGSIRWVSQSAKQVMVNGRMLGMQKTIRNITEHIMDEHSLKVSEEKYKTLLNASPDGILLIDMCGIITEISEIGLELFGADTKDDLVGKLFFKFIPSEERNVISEIIGRTMNEGLVQNIELKFRKIDQSVFSGETNATLIESSFGEPLLFMVIIRDISKRKKIEAMQIHADRMVNLGKMASGIAHEINQPLNIISLVMDKILFESTRAETVDIQVLKKKSNKIFENIIRIRNIIDHVRAFSRNHQNYILTAFDINSSIENATSMMAEQFKHLGISLKFQLEKQIPQILGNTYKFEQVIINLLVNAQDALIEKKSKQEEDFEMIIDIRSYQEDQFLVVEIVDNGIGINDDDIDNVILPFYTTKEEGKGTGLGLSICYQIIKEMNGVIDIKSDSINGTKFKIVLDIQKN